jgi:proteasome lid subunit RPN8/RPN11
MSLIQMTSELTYRLADANWSLVVGASVVSFLMAQAQRGRTSRERIGQLYSRNLSGSRIVVDAATLLEPRQASFARVTFDTQRMAAERRTQFEQGLHFVGLWHTHPEPHPFPSELDRRLAEDHARAASDVLAGIVFMIMGNLSAPRSLRVWIQESASSSAKLGRRLLPMEEQMAVEAAKRS